MPKYQTEGSSGLDLHANIEEPIILNKNDIVLVPTGLFIEIPEGYEAQIRSRSSLALKNGIFCLNSPATIDSDYRGELKIILASLTDKPFTINHGDRIAQMVFAKVEKICFEETDSILQPCISYLRYPADGVFHNQKEHRTPDSRYISEFNGQCSTQQVCRYGLRHQITDTRLAK